MKTNDQCPCINCVPPKRTPTCHAKCPEYAEFCANLKQKKQEKRKAEEVDVYFSTKRKYNKKWI